MASPDIEHIEKELLHFVKQPKGSDGSAQLHEMIVTLLYGYLENNSIAKALELYQGFLGSINSTEMVALGLYRKLTTISFWLNYIAMFKKANDQIEQDRMLDRFLKSKLSKEENILCYYQSERLAASGDDTILEPDMPIVNKPWPHDYPSIHDLYFDESIKTDRLILKPLNSTHTFELYQIFLKNKEKLSIHFAPEYHAMESPLGLERFLQQKEKDWINRTSFYWGIFNPDHELIGKLELYGIDWRIPKGFMSYFITREHEGKGLVSEAVKSIINLCFEQFEFLKLELRTATDNYPSHSIAKKFGFENEGKLKRNYRRFNNDVVDLLLWGLTNDQWIQNNS